MLGARADGRDPIAGHLGEREFAASTEVDDLVDVTGLVALARIRSQAVKPSGQALLVTAEPVDVVAFLDDHAARRQIPMEQPAAPNHPVLLLALGRVGQEDTEEFAAAIITKIDIGEGDAATG